MNRTIPVLVLGLSVAAAGCFRTTGVNRFQPNLYSVDQEIGLGKELSRSIEQEVTLVRHHGLVRLVESIGRTCQEHASEEEFALYPFTFRVVDSSEVNAFSLPGGPVYVNLGLIELADSEDELAAVIAHEMAHVVSRHATERMTTMQLTQMALLVTLSAVGGAPAAAVQGGQLAYILGILRYSRSMETEADRMALAVLRAAGYDPAAMGRVLRRLEEERRMEPLLLERWMSSHPLPDERIATVEGLLAGEEADERLRAARATGEFERMKTLFTRD